MRDLLFCRFCTDEEIPDKKLQFAVIVATYKEKMVFVKHKKRNTYEIPGGKRNGYNEKIEECAKRELEEETGAITFNIEPISTYAIRKNREGSSEYYGKLFYADITELGNLPDTEIGEVLLTDKTPENLTYPHIQPNILNKINDYRKSKNLEALKIL